MVQYNKTHTVHEINNNIETTTPKQFRNYNSNNIEKTTQKQQHQNSSETTIATTIETTTWKQQHQNS